jgi:hypothetical protein
MCGSLPHSPQRPQRWGQAQAVVANHLTVLNAMQWRTGYSYVETRLNQSNDNTVQTFQCILTYLLTPRRYSSCRTLTASHILCEVSWQQIFTGWGHQPHAQPPTWRLPFNAYRIYMALWQQITEKGSTEVVKSFRFKNFNINTETVW